MKNLNKAILIALGMALPLSVMASPDDDVTIRIMEMNEHAAEAVTGHIELPEAADDHARENAAKGMETANENRNEEHGDSDHDIDDNDRDHEMEREEDHEREMEREEDHEREMDHGSDDAQPEFEAPERDDDPSSHGPK